jgi:hypothetical protein
MITNEDTGWEMVPRPKQTGMTIWRGNEPLQGTFSFLLDGYRTGPIGRVGHGSQRLAGRVFDPQTPNINNLWKIARGDGDSRPGLISIEGIPEFPNIDWIIESMSFEDDGSIRSAHSFKQARIKCNMTVRQYMPPRYVPDRTPTGSPKGKTVTWKCRHGDTPANIARRIGCKWTDIRELNKKIVKKSNMHLKAGTRIRVPATKDANRLIHNSKSKSHKNK